MTEIESGVVELEGNVKISTEPTDHRPVDPTIAFRFDYGDDAVVVAGDTIPCADLDKLCSGAKGLVHTVIRKDIIENIPLQSLQDVCDYHSSVEEASQTAERAGIETLDFNALRSCYFPQGKKKQWSMERRIGDDLPESYYQIVFLRNNLNLKDYQFEGDDEFTP